jgi:small-conductance mechanosensitive channel
MSHLRLVSFGICVLFAALLVGQESAPGARIAINGQTLFVLRSGVGSFSPNDRAKLVNQRLQDILKAPPPAIATKIEKTDVGLLITVGDEPIISVTDADTQAENLSREALAARWRQAIGQGLQDALNLRSQRTFWRRLGISASVVLGAVLLIIALRRLHAAGKRALAVRRTRIPALRLRGLELVSAEKLFRIVGRCHSIAYGFSLLLVTIATLLLVFAQFPDTRGYARQVALWIWAPLVAIFRGIVAYLPNLFFILVIVAFTRMVVRGVDFVSQQAERGVISLEPWVHRDVARSTAQILKAILIILALFFIAPLVPGTGSTAAKGLSVIIGLMVSFGSSSTVGNLIAGVVLTYMRPYHLGDRVKLGDTEGDVVERRFLYTKVVTIKNEEVIVPSLQALSNAMVNYSARAKETGLILHTSVTIGYDAPWRKVHELLIRAAEGTEGILKEPRPFVMQTSLNDFFVSYQLNAYTDQANRKAMIYSELHQNIQDSFNEGGIEILSPHYFQLRDGNTSTIPEEYRGKDYEPRRFLVETHADGKQRVRQAPPTSGLEA